LKTKSSNKKGYRFGTAPVFLAAISTILGAILFLRFGYAVAHAGVLGTILIILTGHLITIPTALAIAEIATNLKVEGGGEYFIISRSFGSIIGGTIGIALYFSQAISVAFYMIAFSEAFTPVFDFVLQEFGFTMQTWMISIPTTLVLLIIMLKKGANLGVTALWGVISILTLSIFLFFIGQPENENSLTFDLFNKISLHDDFFLVFAIIFPAFTGMTAGVGLSGDLKNPRKSIPLGTLSATFVGMIVYIFIAIKLGSSLSPEELAADQFAMSKIALWGPIIPIGLAAASLSSAIGSILVAPRTLQALAIDKIWPTEKFNKFLSLGFGDSNEPRNATLITAIVVFSFVSAGSINFVAQIISMFFMITYGTLCLVSFLEHFAGNPSYRPTFRSKWYFSLLGAIACFIVMFQMAPLYAFFAIVAIILIYLGIRSSRKDEDDLSAMVRGVLFQLTRSLQVVIQRKHSESEDINWRPSFIAISSDSFKRVAPFDLLRWISHYHGFGTFIHYIQGFLTEKTSQESKKIFNNLIEMAKSSRAELYVDTVISPSFKTAVAQIIQIPGIAGMENNSILFEFHEENDIDINNIIEGCQFAAYVDFNICVLRSSVRHFGYKKNIHIWLTPGDYRNAGLMILLSYILKGNPEWKESEIELFVAFEEEELDKEAKRLNRLIDAGRIPISHKNVEKIPWKKNVRTYESLVSEQSGIADLVIMGFSLEKLTYEKGKFFKRFANINDVLFVRAGQKIAISDT
jgi:amino acid transporter